ncbi:MAG TPA: transglycosylase domain-containing protein [Deltaproteobacteria bacterium]|nr:transglycosylase domain-containing protein [Deltaproteobacteria bacterium]
MTRTRRFIIWGMCALVLLGMLLVAVWTANAYREMRKIRTGALWRLPTRVYASPLQLSPGMDIARAGLTERLARLRYRQSGRAGSPGQYSTVPGRMVIRRRRFVDADGDHPSARVELDLEGSRIRRVLSGDSRQEVSSARLEPECIATLYDGGFEDREIVSLKDCPPVLIDALLSVEDRRFRDHPGIDVRAVSRALLADLFSARVVEGGSTITQQLVKNLFLSHERTVGRKLKEAWLALIMEAAFTKDEILAMYLNEIYLGRSGYAGIHGFARASRLFFDKEVSSLGLHEAALLAGIVRSPNRYSPYTHPRAALDRRNTVLTLMHDQGRVSTRSYREALRKPLGVVPFTPAGRQAPYFVDYVVSALRRLFPGGEGAVTSGLNVYTTLDMHAQRTAEEAVRSTIASMPERVQAAVVVLRPSTGEILAMVGGRDYRVSQFNRAVSARRSIGSLIKPIVFYTALRNGYTLSSLVEDAPVSVPLPDGSAWSPTNFDGRSHGKVLLVDALAFSYNQATVRLGLDVGLDRVAAEAKKVLPGIRVPAHPSLLLGQWTVRPWTWH